MSEKKTLQQMASAATRHVKSICTKAELEMFQSWYLDGLEAGARMAWLAAEDNAASDGDFNGYIKISFDEWWASLEGEKSST